MSHLHKSPQNQWTHIFFLYLTQQLKKSVQSHNDSKSGVEEFELSTTQHKPNEAASSRVRSKQCLPAGHISLQMYAYPTFWPINSMLFWDDGRIFSSLFFKKKRNMDILLLERHSIRNSAPETQILLVREKQFFLLFKGGEMGRRKRRGEKKKKKSVRA